MSFLQKLKKRGVISQQTEVKTESGETLTQLEVDVCRIDDRFLIYAPVFGARAKEIMVDITGNDDVVTIIGQRRRPKVTTKSRKEGDFMTEECVWGKFYRRIILPAQVDVDSASVELVDGVLLIELKLI